MGNYGLMKAHHGIMKMTALRDYECVKEYCELNGIETSKPKGKHWHKIEDATSEMIKRIGIDRSNSIFRLNRGVNYYAQL